MGQYGKSLYVDDSSYIPAAHFQNGRVPRDEACYTCHTDYTIFDSFSSKLKGLHHIYAQYVTKPQQPIKLYHPYNNRECLHCNEGSRSIAGPVSSFSRLREVTSRLNSNCSEIAADKKWLQPSFIILFSRPMTISFKVLPV
jgi:cytochrome c-type protein NapC